MSAQTSDSDVEFMILKRVKDGPLPVTSADLHNTAPVERWAEMIDAGLIDGTVVLGGNGEPQAVYVTGIHLGGRRRMEEIEAAKNASRPAALARRHIERVLWAAVGIGITLLTQYLSKLLGLTD